MPDTRSPRHFRHEKLANLSLRGGCPDRDSIFGHSFGHSFYILFLKRNNNSSGWRCGTRVEKINGLSLISGSKSKRVQHLCIYKTSVASLNAWISINKLKIKCSCAATSILRIDQLWVYARDLMKILSTNIYVRLIFESKSVFIFRKCDNLVSKMWESSFIEKFGLHFDGDLFVVWSFTLGESY